MNPNPSTATKGRSRGPINIADLFCGAGGTSTGAIQAAEELGYTPHLTAVNHWQTAVNTHTLNHPAATHLCASVDSLNPRDVMRGRTLDLLWASPECVHHSRARGAAPMNDQSRATGHCVTRWAEALRPGIIWVENVPEFVDWGPLNANNKPLQSKKGATFRAWLGMLESLGYRVDYRILCAADYGDPTTRRRLFVQAVRGNRRITWPEPSHAQGEGGADLFGAKPRWRAAREIIDWALPSTSIYARKKPLAANTLRRIYAGLQRYGLAPYIVAWDHQSGSGLWSQESPLSTVTTKARHGVVEPMLLPQQSCGQLRPVSEPCPTVACAGAIGLVEPFIVSYYGNGNATRVDDPLATVTTHDRFGLAQPEVVIDGQKHKIDIRFRMLQPHELAAAQGFPVDYQFTGTKTEIVKQIGNAVPCGMAKALVKSSLALEA